MTALDKDRNTKIRGEVDSQLHYPVAASTTIYAGSLVALNTSGLAVPAANTAGLVVVGRCAKKADNASGAASAINVIVETGAFYFVNGTATIAQADVGRPCFVEDDQTVGDTATAGVIAGIIRSVDSADGVLVGIGLPQQGVGVDTLTNAGAMSPATSHTNWSVTGAVAGTLADGIYHGQRKTIRCTVAGGGPAGTLTPATPSGFATILFDAVGECAELMWIDGTGWIVTASAGATVS